MSARPTIYQIAAKMVKAGEAESLNGALGLIASRLLDRLAAIEAEAAPKTELELEPGLSPAEDREL